MNTFKMKSEKDASKIIKRASVFFFVIAGLQGIAAYYHGSKLFYGYALTFSICAFFLWRFKSRVAAIILLIVSSGGALIEVIQYKTVDHVNIMLSLTLLFSSIRVVQATFKLNNRSENKTVDSYRPSANV